MQFREPFQGRWTTEADGERKMMCACQGTPYNQYDLMITTTTTNNNDGDNDNNDDDIVDFAFSADHRIKLKECEKKDKYLDLARELKKLWKMKVTIIPIVICAFSTVTKGLLKGLKDLEVGRRVETIQTTALLRTARILRRFLETWGHSNPSEKPSANAFISERYNSQWAQGPNRGEREGGENSIFLWSPS